ncbi:MAG: metal ABC transporter permease, partial [Atopobium minutum]|nr:metal ABC transporter permease [Atopobium minutum]
ILTVSNEETLFVIAVTAVAVLFCFSARRSLFLLAYDETQARICGVNVPLMNASFIAITALIVAVASRTVGSLMVSSMMVVPVACALQLAKSWKTTCLVACSVGVISPLVGLTISFYLGLKPGGTIVLLSVALLAIIFAIRSLMTRASR